MYIVNSSEYAQVSTANSAPSLAVWHLNYIYMNQLMAWTMMLTPTPRKNVKHVFLVKCRKSLSQNRANTGQPDHMRLYTVMYVAQFKWNQKAAENTCSHSQMTFHRTPLLTSLKPRVKCFRNSWNLMLCQAKLPLEFWAEACSTAVYHHNQSPRAALKDETPFQRLFGRRPYISNLRVFGCVSYVHVPDSQRRKLDGKAHRTIFVGYPPGVKGYKLYCYIPRLSLN